MILIYQYDTDCMIKSSETWKLFKKVWLLLTKVIILASCLTLLFIIYIYFWERQTVMNIKQTRFLMFTLMQHSNDMYNCLVIMLTSLNSLHKIRFTLGHIFAIVNVSSLKIISKIIHLKNTIFFGEKVEEQYTLELVSGSTMSPSL